MAKKLSVLTAVAVVCFASAAIDSAQIATEERVELVDLTPEFARFWETSRTLPNEEKVAAFKSHFDPLIPGFFRSKYFDPLIGKSLDSFEQDRRGIEVVSRSFGISLKPAKEKFSAIFGASPVDTPIFLIHSTGELDGSVRRIQGKDHLVFGADRIAKRLDAAGKVNIQPLLHHEVFHLHHNKHFTGCWDTLWCDIWREGLATFAAESLNPDASAEDLGIADLRAALDEDPSPAICLVAGKLDSKDQNERRDFISMNFTVSGMPPRFGYYVGYLAAKELSSSHMLPKLAEMQPSQVRPILEQSLRRLADCT